MKKNQTTSAATRYAANLRDSAASYGAPQTMLLHPRNGPADTALQRKRLLHGFVCTRSRRSIERRLGRVG